MDGEEFKVSVLRALAHPTRRKILALTQYERRHPEDLAKELGVSRATIEGHLEELEKVGLIAKIADTTGKVFISTTPPGRILFSLMDDLLEGYKTGKVGEIKAKPSLGIVTPPSPPLPKPEENLWGRFMTSVANSLKRWPAEWISFLLFMVGIIFGYYGYSMGLYLGGLASFVFSFIIVPVLYLIIRKFFKALGAYGG